MDRRFSRSSRSRYGSSNQRAAALARSKAAKEQATSYVPPGIRNYVPPGLPYAPGMPTDTPRPVVPPGLPYAMGMPETSTPLFGEALKQKIAAYRDQAPARENRNRLEPKKEPYSDNVPRLYDYAQMQDKFGTFEEYQKAVEARQQGWVPNDYADFPSEPPGESEYPYPYPSYGGGYGYGTPAAAKRDHVSGARPNWKLWSTMVQETTWNI